MRTYVVASFDSMDRPRIVGMASRLEGLFADEIREDERTGSNRKPCAGIKAIRAIKGNVFTQKNLVDLEDYASVLMARREERIGRVEEERNAIERDAPSLNAYDFLINGMRDGLNDARRQLEDFMETTSKAW